MTEFQKELIKGIEEMATSTGMTIEEIIKQAKGLLEGEKDEETCNFHRCFEEQ